MRRLALLAALLTGLHFVPAAPSAGPDGHILVLPDTQLYTAEEAWYQQFLAQAEWIEAQALDGTIGFVTHVGDLVQDGAQGEALNQLQWDRAMAAIAALDGELELEPDGLVPYGVVPGNHDYDTPSMKGPAEQFLAHFGPQRYAGRAWFVGSSEEGTSFAQRFQVGEHEYLGIGLEWRPSDDALAWAQTVLDAHPRTPAIVTTHQHLTAGARTNHTNGGGTPDTSGDNSGESVYRKLVEPNPQVFLVFCGHVPGNSHLDSSTALGQPVHEVLTNYQDEPNGGNGWLGIVALRESTAEIEFSAYSPTYVPGVTPGPDHTADPDANFLLSFDFAAHRARLENRELRRFRAATGPDASASFEVFDTHVGDGTVGLTLPGVPHGGLGSVAVDADEDGEQGLIAFHGIIGPELDQIPPGVQVERAILTLTTEGPDAPSRTGARLHRMLVEWDEDSTWDSLGSGIQIGAEALAEPELDLTGRIGDKGTDSFDVTASVQAWVDGAANHGWLAQAGGDDRWELRSSQWAAEMERPALTVIYSTYCSDAVPYCEPAPNSAGPGAHLSHTGSTSVGANDLVLHATGLPPGQSTQFFYGPVQEPALPFGEGFLCIGAGQIGVFRWEPPIHANGEGALQYAVDLTLPPSSAGAGRIEPGSTWHAQLWYRDPQGGPSGYNLSEALSLTWCR